MTTKNEKFRLKYLIMDVDGTLTDGKVYISSTGELVKAFNIKDGYGIRHILPANGIVPVVVTGRLSEIVKIRCDELNISAVYQGVDDKLSIIRGLEKDLSKIAYIGDDLNDAPCMLAIRNSGGLTGCPADAVGAVKGVSCFVSEHNGGDGAVRDFIDWLLSSCE